MALLFVGGYEGQILTLKFDPSDGSLAKVASFSEKTGIAPTWLELSPDGQTLYAADEWATGEGEVFSYKVDEHGSLSHTGQVRTFGRWPCHACILQDARRLLVANYKGGTVAAVPLLADGSVETDQSKVEMVDLSQVGTNGPHPTRQDGSHVHGVHLSPDGRHVVVPDLGTDDLIVLAVNESGLAIEGTVRTRPGDGPRHCLFHKIGAQTFCYVLNELSNSVSVFRRDDSAGGDKLNLTPVQEGASLLPEQPFAHQKSFATWHAAELAISADGIRLLATNRSEDHQPENPPVEGPDDLIAIFKIGNDGQLRGRKLVASAVRAPRHLSLKTLGGKEYMAMPGHDNDRLVIHELRGQDLIEVARIQGVGKPGVAVWA